MDREISKSSDDGGKASPSSSQSQNNTAAAEDAQQLKKPSWIKSAWNKTGLDAPTLMLMVKAAIPPTIATAIYQADAVANEYTTLGYLVSIMSILGFAIMPRAKFVQTMFFNVVSACLGAAVGLLAIWTSLKARENSTPAGAPPSKYNASASTVMGIWLFFQIFLTNALRSARPQLQFPCIIYSIFAIVTSTYGALFPNMTSGISFEVRLLKAFLTGFAIATGVSLFFIPVTSRKVVFKEFTGYLKGMQGVLRAQTTYLQSLEAQEIFGPVKPKRDSSESDDDQIKTKNDKKSKANTTPPPSATKEGKALQGAVQGLLGLHSKLNGDLAFAERETAFGKLGSSDMKELFRLLRRAMIPLIGLSSMVDIFDRIAKLNGWDAKAEDLDEKEAAERTADKAKATEEWQKITKSLHEPFSEITEVVVQGIQHVLLQLQLEKPPNKSKADIEAKAGTANPGSKEFAENFKGQISKFYNGREVTLRAWCEQKGIDATSNSPFHFDEEMHDTPINELDKESRLEAAAFRHTRLWRGQRQLFLLLFLEYLMYSASVNILQVVQWVDEKVDQGRLSKRRLIVPPSKTLRKWIRSVLDRNDDPPDDHLIMAEFEGSQTTYLGDAFFARRDPEHLPPETTVERLGNYIRTLPHALKSPHAMFGLRAACATMSIGIVAFLRDSYNFFIQQRLLWAMIMVAFSMSRTSGQSAFNFVLRVLGTVIATIACYVIWYIVDGKTPGVIVFQFVWVFICFYIPLKKPQFVVIGIISAVTAVLVLGYELEVRKIGVAQATTNGQPAYPLYQLAPYRLATVAGGLAVAYIWTIFPYPITENFNMRQSLAGAMYLLANYYSAVHETVNIRMDGREGNPDDKLSPGRRLDKVRSEVFVKVQTMVDQLSASSAFSKWQINVGGRFPKENYDNIIKLTQTILHYVALMGFASETFSDSSMAEVSRRDWLIDFRKIMSSVSTRSNEVTSLLSLLSSSMASGQPLPPYLKAPNPYMLLSKLEATDKDILSVKHIAEPGYAAFAVIQVASRTVIADLDVLLAEVRKLVGELDFTSHIVKTSDSKTNGETEEIKKADRKKDQ